jgi:hypothetical protein
VGSIVIPPKSSFLISAISLWMRFSAIYEHLRVSSSTRKVRRGAPRSWFGSHWACEVLSVKGKGSVGKRVGCGLGGSFAHVDIGRDFPRFQRFEDLREAPERVRRNVPPSSAGSNCLCRKRGCPISGPLLNDCRLGVHDTLDHCERLVDRSLAQEADE